MQPERLAENSAVFDWELDEVEMKAISALNNNARYNDPGVYCTFMGEFYPIFD